jgi:hypothetical protein
MHWLVIKIQPVYVSCNFRYQYEALSTAIVMASGSLKRNQLPDRICLWLSLFPVRLSRLRCLPVSFYFAGFFPGELGNGIGKSRVRNVSINRPACASERSRSAPIFPLLRLWLLLSNLEFRSVLSRDWLLKVLRVIPFALPSTCQPQRCSRQICRRY